MYHKLKRLDNSELVTQENFYLNVFLPCVKVLQILQLSNSKFGVGAGGRNEPSLVCTYE
jgi:hypothetical protein